MLALIILWAAYEGYNYFRFHDIEVVDYKTLVLRAEYGGVTLADVQRGAEHIMEYHFCTAALEENANQQCLENFHDRNEKCATQHIFGAQFDEVDESTAYTIIRRYKVCIEDGI